MIFLLAAFWWKHVIADLLLRCRYIDAGKYLVSGWEMPLLLHSAIHGVFTTGVVFYWLYIGNAVIWQYSLLFSALYGIIDLVSHAIIDRFKCLLHRRKFAHPWILTAADQLAHTGVYLIIIYSLIQGGYI